MDDHGKSGPAPRDPGSIPLLPGSPPSTISCGTLRLDSKDLLRYREAQSFRGSLLVIAGTPADIGTHLVIETAVLIGREPIGLQLRDPGISRSHATVKRRDNEYVIRDLGSTNGTLVNGARLHGEQILQEGDKILLGQTVIKFTLVDETEASYLRQVTYLVGTDDLTGLMSKHRFDAAFKESIRTARTTGASLAAMMMDMDGLKAINERYGHQAGAETVSQVGRLVGTLLRGRGEACRFGGDEFSAFLPGADLPQVLLMAEQIRRGVERLRVQRGEATLNASISIGVAILLPMMSEASALLHMADQALYRAKAKGKNTVSD